MPPAPARALSPCDWVAIRLAYETTTDTPVEIARRYEIHHFKVYGRIRGEQWHRAIAATESEPRTHSLVSVTPSPLAGEGRGRGEGATGPTVATAPPPHVGIAQRDPDVVLPLKVGGGGKLTDPAQTKAEPVKPKRPPKRQGMIDRLYRVIDNNLSQLEDIMKNQSDPSIADNEKETRTIGTVIGNIEKLKGLEDDAGKSNSRANKSTTPGDTAAETQRVRRELAERFFRLHEDLRP